ncbi:flippase [Coraliomargarita sp. W4R53]
MKIIRCVEPIQAKLSSLNNGLSRCKQSKYGKIFYNLIWLFTEKFIKITVGLVVSVLLARHLGPEDFGLFSYALSITAIFAVISKLGTDTVVVREIAQNRQRASEYLTAAFVLRMIGAVASIAFIFGLVQVLHPDESLSRLIVVLSSLSLLFKTTDVAKHWFEAEVESHYTVRIETAVYVVSGLFKIGFVLLDLSLLSFFILNLVESIFTALGMLSILQLKGRRFNFRIPLKAPIKNLFKHSWPLMFASLAVTVYMRVDIIMLEIMAGTDQAGIYAAATRVSEVWYFVPVMIMGTLSPYIMRAKQKNNADYRSILQTVYCVLTWLALALTVPIIFYAKSIITTIYGYEYNASAQILPIHLWSSVAIFLSIASSQYLLAENLQKVSLYRSIIGATANVVINFLLIPKYGPAGAAAATLISYYLSLLSLLLFKSTRQHACFLFASIFKYKESFRLIRAHLHAARID